MDRPRPEAVQVAERVLGVVELQVDPEVLVLQVQLAAVPVVAVLDADDRLAEVGQAEQEPLLDLLELAALDLVASRVWSLCLKLKSLCAAAEVGRQERRR